MSDPAVGAEPPEFWREFSRAVLALLCGDWRSVFFGESKP